MERDGSTEVRTERFLAPALMLAAVLLFFLKPLFLGVSFQDPAAFHHDVLAAVPTSISLVETFYRTGHPPLWLSNLNLGQPGLGLYLPSLAHPLVLGLMRFSVGRSLALLSLVNSELIALFAFLLFRRCGASAWAAAGAGFLLTLTGFAPWVSLIYPVSLSVPWLLCWLWSAMGLTENSRLRAFAGNALSVLMILLCGDAQMTVEGAYLLCAWYFLWVLRARVPWPRLARSLALLVAAAAIGWVLASVQLLPAMLCFSRSVTTRAPTLGDFASTFPKAENIFLAGLGLFSRLYRNLFLPFSVALLLLAAFRRRENAAFQASLILAAAVGFLVVGGRSGLAVIPFHLPMLKLFIRHYKLAVILQGPLFIGVALGFDALLEALQARNRVWLSASLLGLLFTLIAIPSWPWRIFLLVAAAMFGMVLISRNLARYAPGLLMGLLVIDAGSYLWQTPYRLSLPLPDPKYLHLVQDLGPQGRVQGMYPWTARAAAFVNQPLPVHGNGYFGEYSLDSWLEFPLRNHAYFLAALSPRVARINHGVFSNVDFSSPFKSTDFVTPQNRPLVNLAALRYFFLQDFALAAADRFPILSDPEYLANPARPRPFAPFERFLTPNGRPALSLSSFGTFRYQKYLRPGDRISATLAPAAAGPGQNSAAGWVSLTCRAQGKSSLVFSRALSPRDRFLPIPIRQDLSAGSGDGELDLSLLPLSRSLTPKDDREPSAPVAVWQDPQLVNPGRTIKYIGGDRVMAFDNQEAFGRARIVHRGRVGSGNDQALAIMRDPSQYDPARETLLMTPGAPLLSGSPGRLEPALLESYRDNEVVIRAGLYSPGYLVLADTYYPGWRVFDERGKEHRIYRADLNFRAVSLPAGGHDLTFRYLPADFQIGLFVTLVSLLFLAAASALPAPFRKR